MTGRIEKTVFISYRRTNLPWALFVYQNLTMHGYDVFFDYQSIDSGNFESVILDNIKARAHFIVILTPSALENCNKPGDWLRREIETAMDENRNIVPLMVENFDFGSTYAKDVLTGKLAGLSNFNGLPVPNAYALEAMERLRERYLNKALSNISTHALQPNAQKITETQKSAANEAAPIKEEQLTAQEWFERGYVYGRDNYEDSIRCYSEAIKIDKDFADAYTYRGLTYWVKGFYDEAIADFNKAIQIQPKNNKAYLGRGMVYRDKGNVDEGLADFNVALRLKPEDTQAYFGRAMIYRANNRLDEAISDFNESIRLNPKHYNAFYHRAVTRRQNGDLEGAIADFIFALGITDVEAPLIYVNLGFTRTSKGDLEGAIANFNEAITLKPDFEYAYLGRAIAWEELEDYASAISDYQEYLALGGRQKDQGKREIEATIKKLKSKLVKKKPARKKQSK